MIARLVSTVAIFSLSYYLLFSYYDPIRSTAATLFTSLLLTLWLFHFRRVSMIVLLKKQIILIIINGCLVWFVLSKAKEHPIIRILLEITFTLFFLACQETSKQLVKWFKSR